MADPVSIDVDLLAKQIGGWAGAILAMSGALYGILRMRNNDKRSDEKNFEIDLFYRGITDRIKELERRIDEGNTKYAELLKSAAEERILALQDKVNLSNKLQVMTDEIDELRMSNAMLRSEVEELKKQEVALLAENATLKGKTPGRRAADPPAEEWYITGG